VLGEHIKAIKGADEAEMEEDLEGVGGRSFFTIVGH